MNYMEMTIYHLYPYLLSTYHSLYSISFSIFYIIKYINYYIYDYFFSIYPFDLLLERVLLGVFFFYIKTLVSQ